MKKVIKAWKCLTTVSSKRINDICRTNNTFLTVKSIGEKECLICGQGKCDEKLICSFAGKLACKTPVQAWLCTKESGRKLLGILKEQLCCEVDTEELPSGELIVNAHNPADEEILNELISKH